MRIHAPGVAVALFLVMTASIAAEPPAPTAAASAPATQAAKAPAAASSSNSAAIAKAAHSLGYKSHQSDGNSVYCKSETKVGTSFKTTTCLTEDQVMATVKRSDGNKDSVEALQRAFLAAAPDKYAQF